MDESERRTLLIKLLRFIGGFALSWIAFTVLFRAFPFIQNGSDLIYRYKEQYLHSEAQFARSTRFAGNKPVVLFLGNSKMLAGIIPDEFDALLAHRVRSYNAALPDLADSSALFEVLKSLEKRDQLPEYVVFADAWMINEPRVDLFHWLRTDKEDIMRIFPFRMMIRDFVLFGLRAREKGGMRRFYDYCRQSKEKMFEDRGYYFIEGQSHYPSHSLRDDFRAPGDNTAISPRMRILSPVGREYELIRRCMREHNMIFVYIPYYFRDCEFGAPPAMDESLATISAHYPQMKIVGPEYLRYPNRFFSDIAHLNSEGARAYTREIADAFLKVAGLEDMPGGER